MGRAGKNVIYGKNKKLPKSKFTGSQRSSGPGKRKAGVHPGSH